MSGLVERQAAARLELRPDVLLGDLAVAGLRQRVPEEHPLRKLVAGDLALQPRQEFRLVDRSRSGRRTQTATPTSPQVLSGTPRIATSAIAGCVRIFSSISRG